MQFVILYHETPTNDPRQSHWDLMLEMDDELLTWALESLPLPNGITNAIRLSGHRKAYLEYEGLVSENRGSVKRVVSGTYGIIDSKDSSNTTYRLDCDQQTQADIDRLAQFARVANQKVKLSGLKVVIENVEVGQSCSVSFSCLN